MVTVTAVNVRSVTCRLINHSAADVFARSLALNPSLTRVTGTETSVTDVQSMSFKILKRFESTEKRN